ncbi:MAG: rRNA maturation RNase YbeY [Patescibacteria group bacterium]|jgi:probable rRNA maturation factor|nr:rRNA maturation RNase YbeY [Patescibacteria group bacterium]
MPIDISNKTRTKIDLKLVKKVSEQFLTKYKKNKFELSVVFVGDRRMQTINKIYRGYNKITDILSFEGEEEFLGELIIDYAQIERQAKNFNNSVREELVFILVHGLLHLLGYDDKTEKEEFKMIALGENFIKTLKL